jgi:DNA polymerase III alpha subunit (gram-positive type)
MEKFSKAQKEERFDELPEALREAIFADESDEVVYSLTEKYQLTDSQQKKIARICLYVFLGFTRIKDVFEELAQEAQLDSKIALAVYQELEQKVFGPYKTQIEENYRAFQEKPHDVEFPKTQEQIVLKNPIEEGAVNLKYPTKEGMNENIVSTQKQSTQTPNGSIPVSLDILGDKGLGVSEKQITQTETRNPFVNPTIAQQKNETKPDPQGTRSPSIFNHQPPTSSENAPFILHKREEAIPIAQSQAQKGYKQMSFGSFMGSFKTAQSKEPEISRAQVEIPGIPVSAPQQQEVMSPALQKNTSAQVPFSVKKYETPPQTEVLTHGEVAKVVHYAFEDNSSNANSKPQAPNPKS